MFMRKSCVSWDQDKYNLSVGRPFLWVGITMVVVSSLMLSASVFLLYFYTELRFIHGLLLIQFSSRLCVSVCIVQCIFPSTCVPFHYHIVSFPSPLQHTHLKSTQLQKSTSLTPSASPSPHPSSSPNPPSPSHPHTRSSETSL